MVDIQLIAISSVEMFDPTTNEWSNDVTSTSPCRTNADVAVLDRQDGIFCLNLAAKINYFSFW